MNQSYKNIVSFVDDLVANKANFDKFSKTYHLSVDELTETDQNHLAQLFLEHDDREASECFIESNKSPKDDFIAESLIRMLKKNDEESREQFANAVLRNTINRYKHSMQNLIEDRCLDYQENHMNDAGYYSSASRITGEVEWSR
jgi:hypothetical protein